MTATLKTRVALAAIPLIVAFLALNSTAHAQNPMPQKNPNVSVSPAKNGEKAAGPSWRNEPISRTCGNEFKEDGPGKNTKASPSPSSGGGSDAFFYGKLIGFFIVGPLLLINLLGYLGRKISGK